MNVFAGGVVCAVLWWGAVGVAEASDSVPDLVPETIGYSALSAGGRIRVQAPSAEAAQTLAVWGKRGLRDLEKAWAVRLPFPPRSPLELRVTPDTDRVRLRQGYRNGHFRQWLYVPSDPGLQRADEVAEGFVRAMLTRQMLAALPADRKRFDFPVPDWLVVGNRHWVYPGEGRVLFGSVFEGGRPNPMPSPEALAVRGEWRGDVSSAAEAALLCRWVFDSGSRMEDEGSFWATLAVEGSPPAAWWVRWSGKENLRDLHIAWDVWRLAEAGEVIAEFGLAEQALYRLEEALRIVPATYGVGSGEERYREVPPGGLPGLLDAKAIPPLLARWVLRLQEIRFGQGPEFHRVTQGYIEAGLRLREAMTRTGRGRQKGVEEFERLWAAAEEAREAYAAKARSGR